MANPLDRTWFNTLVDDDGTGAVGTVWNKTQIDGLLVTVDASLAAVVDKAGTPAADQVAVFGDADTVGGDARVTVDRATGRVTASGGLALADAQVTSPELRDYAQTKVNAAIVGGVLSLDHAAGNVFEVLVDANLATFLVTNWPASGRKGALEVWFKGNGTGYTQAWGTVRWPGAVAPVLTTTTGQYTVVTFHTFDGGATRFGCVAAQGW